MILRVALAQLNVTVGDVDGNLSLIADAIERAQDAHADVVATPELAVSGYPPEDLLLKPSFIRACAAAVEKLAGPTRGIAAVVGFPELGSDLHNAAAVIADGDVRGVYRKHYLPNYGVFDEDRYFRPGRDAPAFVIAGVKVGVSICEDIWYPTGPAQWQSAAGCEVLVNINGSPFHAGKLEARRRMLATRASDDVVALAYVNLVGGQDELVFDGGSLVLDADGVPVASSPQFEPDLLVVDVDVDAVQRARLHDPRMRKVADPPSGVRAPVVYVSGEHAPPRPALAPRLAPALEADAEVYRALVLGTRDYVDKNGVTRVFVALSGGIDSALTATIAVDALGPARVTGVVLSSRWSSAHSRHDAFELARHLGIGVLDVPIEEPHRAFESVLDPYLAGSAGEDLARQNLQSRIRGMSMLALTNALGGIVLTTGNKSEMATGYATLYGDMAGGFAVLKDVPKTLVYRLANHRNAIGPVIPESTLKKPPSAELRPGQLDTDSLPPYEVLDPILEAYVEEDRSADEIVALGFDRALVARVIRLVDRNEYKRRQAPPGVKVTTRAFGRDRRQPITNRFADGEPAT